MPLGAWDRKAVWIVRYREYLADWLGRKRLPAAGLLSYPAALALSTKDAWNRMLLRRHARREAGVEMCTAFDERFDRFWEELCAEYPRRFLALRTRAMLEWRFHFALREKRLWIATFSRGGRLRAYAIFLLQKNSDPQDPHPATDRRGLSISRPRRRHLLRNAASGAGAKPQVRHSPARDRGNQCERNGHERDGAASQCTAAAFDIPVQNPESEAFESA